MSAFTDQINLDIANVFLDTGEFGEVHSVNGTDIDCVVDTDLGDPRTFGAIEIEGVVADRKRLHAAAEGFPGGAPLAGGTMTLDGEVQPWKVDRLSEEMGMYVVNLSRPRA